MFDRFGKFDSAEELNAAAEGFLQEGDTDSIYAMARENGIDAEDVSDYLDDASAGLVTPLSAAIGKLNVEREDMKLEGVMEAWTDLIIQECIGSEELQRQIRRKDRPLLPLIAKMMGQASKTRKRVDDRIAKAAGIMTPLYIGDISRAEAKKMIDEYYGGEK